MVVINSVSRIILSTYLSHEAEITSMLQDLCQGEPRDAGGDCSFINKDGGSTND